MNVRQSLDHADQPRTSGEGRWFRYFGTEGGAIFRVSLLIGCILAGPVAGAVLWWAWGRDLHAEVIIVLAVGGMIGLVAGMMLLGVSNIVRSFFRALVEGEQSAPSGKNRVRQYFAAGCGAIFLLTVLTAWILVLAIGGAIVGLTCSGVLGRPPGPIHTMDLDFFFFKAGGGTLGLIAGFVLGVFNVTIFMASFNVFRFQSRRGAVFLVAILLAWLCLGLVGGALIGIQQMPARPAHFQDDAKWQQYHAMSGGVLGLVATFAAAAVSIAVFYGSAVKFMQSRQFVN